MRFSGFIIAVLVIISSISLILTGCKDNNTTLNNDSTYIPGKSVYYKKALGLYLNDSLTQSLDYAQKALNHAKTNGDLVGELEADNLLGYIYIAWGDYEKSLEYFLESNRKSEKLPESYQQLASLHGIGRTYLLSKDYDKALEFLNKALELSIHTDRTKDIGKINLELGNVYSEINQNHKSIYHHRKAFELASETNDSISMIYALNNLGLVYINLSMYDTALVYLKRSIDYNSKKREAQAMSAALGNIGDIYLRKGDYYKAIEYIQQSTQISTKHGFRVFEKDSYEHLSLAYENLGDYKMALYYHKLFTELGDSLFNEDKTRALESVREKYIRDEQKMRISVLEAKARNRTIYLWFSLTAVALVLVVLILLVTSLRLRIKLHKREKEEMDLTIDHKNRELVSIMMQGGQKKKMLDELEKTLERLTAKEMKNMKGYADELRGIIKATQDLDNDWDVMKTHFEEVHPNFFKSLQKRHPELSQNDLKLCAYIRINLSTKDIARLFNISDRSVQTAKYRIKKKMNLPANIDLINYISTV